MDYAKHYNRLIDRARNRTLSDYSEGHHVVPKCLGGSDHPDNIVRLTGPEHYVAHLLLVKMHPGNSSLAYAAFRMTHSSEEHGSGRSKNKLYDWLRRRISSEAKKRTGERNGSFGTKWISRNDESKKIRADETVPEGWFIGRSAHRKPRFERVCKCGKVFWVRQIDDPKASCSKACGATKDPKIKEAILSELAQHLLTMTPAKALKRTGLGKRYDYLREACDKFEITLQLNEKKQRFGLHHSRTKRPC